MAASVVDELIVELRLDSSGYSKAEAEVERNAARTERKVAERARTQTHRDKDQQRRLKDVGATVRGFVTQIAAAGAVIGGVGVAVGGALTGLLTFQTGLRRQTVGTSLSNREMQAWGATARRMGADATAGAQAIADLAREQNQYQFGAPAPTMVALGRLGVQTEGREIPDILEDAQRVYRQAPEGQRQQIESGLVASGVSADLILMIKSETDAREAYTKSFGQAIEENRKAEAAVADALESMKAQAIGVAATLLEALQPAIEAGAEKLGEFATKVASVANDLTDAGGSVDAFQQTLDRNFPTLGRLFEGFRLLGDVVTGAGDILVAAFRATADGMTKAGGWFDEQLHKVRAPWSATKSLYEDLSERREQLRGWLGMGSAGGADDGPTPMQRGVLAVDNALRGARRWAEASNAASEPWPSTTPDPLAGGYSRGGPDERATAGRPVAGNAQDIMSHLVTQYRKSPAEAAAIVANLQGESALRPDAYNPEGGGDGARGLAQWRGSRIKSFVDRYGIKPDQATIEQQIEFMMTDPYEVQLMKRAKAGRHTAQSMGVGVSKVYEAHGNVAEDARRGRQAAALERDYRPEARGASGTEINIQTLTVQSDSPGEFVGGLQRLDRTQNYGSTQR